MEFLEACEYVGALLYGPTKVFVYEVKLDIVLAATFADKHVHDVLKCDRGTGALQHMSAVPTGIHLAHAGIFQTLLHIHTACGCKGNIALLVAQSRSLQSYAHQHV